ncbi:MAG TPA: hydantoinase/carbamoylase family amidase [Chloroflexota bacterium]|nr:hydantoinase/carbamoylase family amidase [Chloroflexota bacterium]
MEPERLRVVASKVQIDRVMERIHLLADKARGTGGGVDRLAFSPVEAEAMSLVAGWMQDAGLTVSYDGIGNMYGSSDGNAAGAAVMMAGSHLDSVPNGGPYDGVLGVIGAVEAVEAMRAAGIRPSKPLEIVVWRCEEAALFGQGRLGSLFFTGELSMETLRRWATDENKLLSYLERAAALPQRAAGRKLAGYLELHIEQGRRLEAGQTTIGVVTAIPGAIRWRINLKGRADHSGATPMGMRRDALAAAAELVLAVERAGMEEKSHETVATAAAITALPGAWNVVPGTAQILTDIRGIEEESVARALAFVKDHARGIGARRGVEITFEEATRGVPVKLDPSMVARVDETAAAVGHSAVRMPSGAGHDAQTIAPYAPVGMVFVPSIDGISHAPAEQTKPKDIEAGVQVLAGTWASLAE